MDLAPSEWKQQVEDGMLSNHITSNIILRAAAPPLADAPVPNGTTSTGVAARQPLMEKTADGQPLRCPRCDSSNTKFCYYNNYSLSQPRHFCKACKRYWTRGGTLRNVPVGGGCRKNKRQKKSAVVTSNPSQSDMFLPAPLSFPSPSADLGFLFCNLATSANDLCLPGLPSPYDLSLGFSSVAEENYVPGLCQIPSPSPLQSCGLFGANQTVPPLSASRFLSSTFKEVHQKGEISALTGIQQLAVDESQQIFRELKSSCDVSGNGRSQWEIPSCENTFDLPLFWNSAASTAFGGALWSDSANYGFSTTPLL